MNFEEGYFRFLFENFADANLIIADDKFVECNKSCLTLLKYNSTEELLQTHPSELSPEYQPDGRKSYEKAEEMMNIAMEKGSHRFEWVHKKADGELFHVEVLLTRVDLGKRIVHTVWRDITVRKKIELEKLVLSEIGHSVSTTDNLEELLQSIHKSISKVLYAENCFFALFDKDTNLFSFPYFIDKFDEPPGPLDLGKSCTSYVFNAGRSMIIDKKYFDQLSEMGEVELVGSNSPSWIGVPLKTPAGILGVMVMQHYEETDIYTEDDLRFLDSIGSQIASVIQRKKAEDRTKQERILLQTLINNLPQTVYIKDEKARKLLANKADLKAMGKENETEVIGKTDLEIFGDIDGEHGYQEDMRVITSGEALINHESSFIDKKGKQHWRLVSKVPLHDETGKIFGIVGLGQDITELKNEQDKLIENERRLKELNATKDKFFSIVAHDLKNPFSSIIGFSDLLITNFRAYESSKTEYYLKIISDSAKQSLSLLENLLVWSRAQTGRIEFKPEPTDLIKCISDNINMVAGQAQKKNIKISLLSSDEIRPVFDKNMIDTVLRNLLSNAIKFTPQDGSITISTSLDDHDVQVSVTDTGVGIDEKNLDKLFRIDSNVSTRGTADEAGTGLGLILCKEFVEKHGGRIWVESEKGHGSRFVFSLPK
ncbi:MAG: PAS domain-containing protein [Bacteroidales bacterium]|nr:PAS domain-containing protein [Bacteroidales bacterium]MCB9014045.1 PAS domain-containing protein [Bacteroidales bacterium]